MGLFGFVKGAGFFPGRLLFPFLFFLFFLTGAFLLDDYRYFVFNLLMVMR